MTTESHNSFFVKNEYNFAEYIQESLGLPMDQARQYIDINQIIDIIHQYADLTNTNVLVLDDDKYDQIIKDIWLSIYSAILVKLVSTGLVDCAWDSEINEMIFWASTN